jgi:hypothetical protein
MIFFINFFDLGSGISFLDMTLKVQAKKKKYQLKSSKLKAFILQEIYQESEKTSHRPGVSGSCL